MFTKKLIFNITATADYTNVNENHVKEVAGNRSNNLTEAMIENAKYETLSFNDWRQMSVSESTRLQSKYRFISNAVLGHSQFTLIPR